jgi:hypothetical protein
MAIDQRIRAGRIWPLLVQVAQGKSKLTFAALGPRVGTPPRNLPLPLEVISKYCRQKGWPPLGVIVVNNEATELSDEAKAEMQLVYEFDWTKIKNPFELFASTT